jgi:tRNA(fMet)-specific endonuclease VapC
LRYLLDTNIVIALLNGRPAEIRNRFRDLQREECWFGISSIVLFELWFGAARSERKTENADRIRAFLSGPIEPVPFTGEDARLAGEVGAALQAAGTPIGPYDLLISAQALRTDAILATSNVAEFRPVPGLKWQDWAAGRASSRRHEGR